MGRFSKVILCSMALCSALNAENSGAFIGVSAQVGAGNSVTKTETTTRHSVETTKLDTLITGVGIKLGYKYFFTQGLGIRAYGFVDSGNSTTAISNAIIDPAIHLLNYGVGAEVLYNIVALPSFDFGVFGGLGLGANTYFAGSSQTTTKLNGKTEITNSKNRNTHFQMTLDLGVRAILKSGSSIELGFKAPLLTNTILKDTSGLTTSGLTTITLTTRHNFSLYASYVYAF
ncbi:outer membrane beta-barrel protein [Helicobacter sp. 11S02596-1]|uniref:outer membrane beta-barrel protein n=1 Tax=Helicobacter sp. 11S02596-1 TaxID=1476194 RepID=UPI000BA5A96A|nr:outer membrane beta-barrel protein [Helicobacter sp. 11S02596-1]PAF44439.1 hypothetical protein BJI48_02630 [Helicobacter sp. 11S02596-1]